MRKIIVTKNWQQLDIFCVVFTNEIYKYALIHLFTGTLNELWLSVDSTESPWQPLGTTGKYFLYKLANLAEFPMKN